MKDELRTSRAQVTTDATIVFSFSSNLAANQLAVMQGVSVISGTGSMAWGRNAREHKRGVGGSGMYA